MTSPPSKIGRKSERGPDGRFRPGGAGGPGRREGSRNLASIALDQIAEGEGEAVLRKIIAAAKAGDVQAGALILSRIWPAPKGRRVALGYLPVVEQPADVVRALAGLLGAVANGELSPEEGQAVTELIEAQRKAIELTEIEMRLRALEKGTSLHDRDLEHPEPGGPADARPI
jgi:hypothetical protein